MNRLYGLILADCVCFALFIGLAFAGRKPEESDGETSAPVEQKITQEPRSGTSKVKPRTNGKELRFGIDTEPPTLDPISIVDTLSDGIANKCYNKLLRFHLDAKGELEVIVDLAESYTLAENRIFTFKLRKNVHFHNGREMTSDDVVYSLKRLLSPLSKRPDLIKPFVKGSEEYYKAKSDDAVHDDPNLGIQAIDRYTVRIELDQPFAPFIQHLCTISCAIVAREAVEDKTRTFSHSPMGTGPFKFDEWTSNQQLVFKRNDAYFAGKPRLEAVRFMVLKDRMLQLNQFMAGQLDGCSIPTGHVQSALADAGPENVFTGKNLRTNYIGISSPNGTFTARKNLEPFGTNKLLRQAMNYALDRDYLANVVMEGRGIPAKGILPPGIPGFKEGRTGWKKDLKKARELMAQAGFPGGKGLEPITVLHRNDDDTKHQALAIQNDFSKIGIKIELQALEWKRFLDDVENSPQPMFMLGWIADYPDPDNFLYVLFNTKQFGSEGNQTWYANPEVDRLTEKARTVLDMSERAEIYARVEDIVLEDSPWICTYHALNKVMLRKEIKGLRERATPLDSGTEWPQVDFLEVDVE